jgi:hypothetical protein
MDGLGRLRLRQGVAVCEFIQFQRAGSANGNMLLQGARRLIGRLTEKVFLQSLRVRANDGCRHG